MHKLLIELKDHNPVVRHYAGQCLVINTEGDLMQIKSVNRRALVPKTDHYDEERDQEIVEEYERIAGKDPEVLAVYVWPDGQRGIIASEGLWYPNGRPEGHPGGPPSDGKIRWP